MHPLLFKLKRMYRKEKLPDPFAYLYKWFNRVPRGVFQVGASTGQEIKGFATQGITAGVFVEPLPEAFQKLQTAVRSHPGYVPVNGVCMDVAGKACNFYVSRGAGASSSALRPTGHRALHPDVIFDEQPLVLESTTVDRIAADLRGGGRADVVAPIDLLYLDTQGAELSVLRGAEEFLGQVRYVFTEVSRGGLYENDVGHRELTEYLEARDFALVFLYLNNHGWGDALYVHRSVFADRPAATAGGSHVA